MIDSDTAAGFLRSRRSVRSFQKKGVPRENVRELLDIARFAPTACNSQGISYHVIDDSDTLHQISSVIADWAEQSIETGSLKNSPWIQNTASTIVQYRKDGKDSILRDAPCLIVATAKKEQKTLGRDNTHFSLVYAPTLGLGSCWSGLFEYCVTDEYAPLLKILNISQDSVVTAGLLTRISVIWF